MKARLNPWIALALLGFQLAVPSIMAQEKETGIRTDRLSARQLKVWRAIENIVRAQDADARPLHPKLHSLWQKIAGGRHEVYIEILTPKNMYSFNFDAGSFKVEKCDPDEQKCTAVIRLFPAVIEGACLTDFDRLTGEAVRFKELGKEERYAEVLGHELAHAVCVLEDPYYTGKSRELNRQVEELSLFLRRRGKGSLHEQERQERMASLKSLADELERPAEMAEAEIGREMAASKGGRMGVHPHWR